MTADVKPLHGPPAGPHGPSGPGASLADFERALLGTNPFVRGRVSEPSRSDVDVSSIHGVEFAKLKRRIDDVRRDGNAVGVMLLGNAGVGKSHLLSRLWRWAIEHEVDYVFLHNVLASPERMARYVTSAIVGALANAREGLGSSRLAGILTEALSFPPQQIGRVAGPATIQEELDRACSYNKSWAGDGVVTRVLAHFLHAIKLAERDEARATEHLERARAALAWLSCDSLDPERAALLGFHDDEEEVSVEDDARAEQILCTIFDLCRVGGHPFVLCVDQVDNLDDERFTALASFFHALLDHASNLLLVTSGVLESMLDFKQRGVIAFAAWDRLAQYQLRLAPVTPEQAREILAARCQAFLHGFESLRGRLPLRGRPLFPLSETFVSQTLDKLIEVRARDVIHWARDEWEELQIWIEQRGVEDWLANVDERPKSQRARPPITLEQSIDAAVRRRVRQIVDQRRLNPGTLPPSEDNLASLTYELLLRCVDQNGYSLRAVERAQVKNGARPSYDLVVREQDAWLRDVLTGCTFLATTNPNRSTAALKRLVQDESPPDHQLLVTDEERCPLRLGPKGKEYLRVLEDGPRFQHIALDFAAHAHLDAMYTAIGDARVGDLEVEHPRGTIRTIRENECIAAMHRSGLFKEHPLLNEFLTEGPGPPTRKTPSRLVFTEDYLEGVLLTQVRWRLGMDLDEITRWMLQKHNLDRAHTTPVLDLLVQTADRLHAAGKIDATPTERGGRFIQLLAP